MVYDELPTDSVGTRLEGSIINAIMVVFGIATMTFMFVLCFKYGFMKVRKVKKSGRHVDICIYSFYSCGWVYQCCRFLV